MKNMAIIAVFLVGCTTLDKAGFRDGDAAEVDIWVDVEEEASEDVLEDTPAEVWEEPETDADEDPVEDLVEDEPPCGGPDDDCDDDGATPAEGDCCDENDQVSPAQDSWFSLPYYCPDESFDYNCDGEEEYEHHASIETPVVCGDYDSRSACEAVSGWYDTLPVCGTVGRFVDCTWSTYSWICYPETAYEGLVRCR